MKPRPEHYPRWLRELILPEITNQRTMRYIRQRRELYQALYQLYTHTRYDPACQVLFETVLEGIRLKFKVSELQEKCDRLDRQVRDLTETVKRLDRWKRHEQ